MKTLIIYDNTGYIISQASGEPAPREPQGGVQFMWVDVPEGKKIKIDKEGIGVDTTTNPHKVILEDIPKTNMEIAEERIGALEQSNAELMNLIMMQNITPNK